MMLTINIPSGDVSIVFGGLDVAVHINSLFHPVGLIVDDPGGIVVGRRTIDGVRLFLHDD